jgi:hypothetical protein
MVERLMKPTSCKATMIIKAMRSLVCIKALLVTIAVAIRANIGAIIRFAGGEKSGAFCISL